MTEMRLSADHADTPSARGYRMPAEWAPHEATWLSWPHNRDSWPGVFAGVEPAMVEFVRALADASRSTSTCSTPSTSGTYASCWRRAVPAGAPAFLPLPDQRRVGARPRRDLRDARARAEPRLALDFDYNAWGGKYPPFDLDRESAGRWPRRSSVPRYAKPGVVLEGGSIEVNGEGALLTTEQCLLNPNRNPTLTRADIERLLRDSFGVAEILWLGEGIEGDDTDGHIDDLTRFVAPRHRRDRRRAEPRAMRTMSRSRRIAACSTRCRRRPRARVIELPMPEPQYLEDQRLPASYANFYVANGAVLVPMFGCPADDEACAIVARLLPGPPRRARRSPRAGRGLGALHCLTQQLPAAPAATP